MPNNIRILKLQLNCLKTNTVWAEGSGKFLSYTRNNDNNDDDNNGYC